MNQHRQRRAGLAALLAIGAAAIGLRFVGLSWGLPYPLHPDEGVILARVATMSWGNLNPGFFIYPGLFIYQVFLLDRLVDALGGDGRQVIYAARLLSAAYSLATVGFVYLLGARLADRRAGIIAAVLTAVTGALTLHAHYAVTDTPAAALATGVLWLSVRGWQRRSQTDLVVAAAVAGLAVSTKYSAFVVCFVPWLGAMALVGRDPEPLRRRLAATSLLAAVAIAAFLLTSPYTLLDLRGFLDDMAVETHLQSAARAGFHVDPLESPRLTDRAFVANSVAAVRDLGPIALGLALVGAWGLVRKSPAAALMVGGWVLGYFLFMAPSAIGGQRYMLPVYPALMALAALGIERVAVAISAGPAVARWRLAGPIAAALLVVAAAALPASRALATTRLLARTDTRLVARQWIVANLPQRSHLAREFYAPPIHTDDNYRLSQPFSLTEHPLETYCKEQVDFLILSSLNAARYLDNDARRFAEERAWYERLEERTRIVQRIEGIGDLELHHPEIVVRRLFCPDGGPPSARQP